MIAYSLRAEIAAAVRSVNASFNRLSKSVQDAIEIGYDGLEVELDAAVASGDRDRALAAIRAWREHWLATFKEAGK